MSTYRTGPAIVSWDSITSPKTQVHSGELSYYLEINIPNGPKVQELEGALQQQLQTGNFKGQLPAGGKWGLKPLTPEEVTKLGPQLQGHYKLTPRTTKTPPTVMDKDGKELSPMEYSRMFYAGAVVECLVHTYDFDVPGNKGVMFGVDAIMVLDSNAPKLNVAAGITADEARAAFGIAGAATPPPAQGYTPPPPAQGFTQTPPPPASEQAATPPPPPAGPQMAPGCQFTYEQLQQAGYTDEAMRQAGYLV